MTLEDEVARLRAENCRLRGELAKRAARPPGLHRERVDWVHWDAKKLAMVVTHPTWWTWRDPEDGYQRYADTVEEACIAYAEHMGIGL